MPASVTGYYEPVSAKKTLKFSLLPADYRKDWEVVRKVSIAAGQNLGRSGYEAEQKKAG